MALPASGNPISISQIRVEMCSGSGSLRALSALAGKSTADAMSEFHGYTSSISGYTFTVETLDGEGAGYSTIAEACSDPSSLDYTAYTNSSSIAVGTQLYSDKCKYYPFNFNSYDTSYPYYKIGSNVVTFEKYDGVGTYTGYTVRTVTPCTSSDATISYVFGDYSIGGTGYLYVFYNGSNIYHYDSIVVNDTVLSPASQTLYMVASDSAGGGTIIDYFLNDVFVANYSDAFESSIGSINTSAGNSYAFDVLTGVF